MQIMEPDGTISLEGASGTMKNTIKKKRRDRVLQRHSKLRNRDIRIQQPSTWIPETHGIELRALRVGHSWLF
jgi:hypothetical protein